MEGKRGNFFPTTTTPVELQLAGPRKTNREKVACKNYEFHFLVPRLQREGPLCSRLHESEDEASLREKSGSLLTAQQSLFLRRRDLSVRDVRRNLRFFLPPVSPRCSVRVFLPLRDTLFDRRGEIKNLPSSFFPCLGGGKATRFSSLFCRCSTLSSNFESAPLRSLLAGKSCSTCFVSMRVIGCGRICRSVPEPGQISLASESRNESELASSHDWLAIPCCEGASCATEIERRPFAPTIPGILEPT